MTRSVSCLYAAAAIAFAAGASVQEAKATEAIAVRYIPGAYAGPGAGIVPPMPGAYWAMANVYYNGSAGGNMPFGDNQIALGLKADIWNTVLAGVYVPNWICPATGLMPSRAHCR